MTDKVFSMTAMKTSIILSFFLVVLIGCSAGRQSVHKYSQQVLRIHVFAYELTSALRTIPTEEYIIKRPGYDYVINDKDILDSICTKLNQLKSIGEQPGRFQLRVVCQIEYFDKTIEEFSVDMYGQIRYHDMILEDSYSLLTLLNLTCLGIE